MSRALSDTKRDTAPGKDKWGLAAAKSIGGKNLSILFSHWWAEGMPIEEKGCRTILMHKGRDIKSVGQWRPITIGTILMRLYAKCWDERLRKKVSLNVRRKAFVPIVGCYKNVKTLQEIIKMRKKGRKELNLVFLDLARHLIPSYHVGSCTHSADIPTLRTNYESNQRYKITVYMKCSNDATIINNPSAIHMPNFMKKYKLINFLFSF